MKFGFVSLDSLNVRLIKPRCKYLYEKIDLPLRRMKFSLNLPSGFKNAEIAQLVERNLAKVEVAGSSPVFRSLNRKVPKGTFLLVLSSKC